MSHPKKPAFLPRLLAGSGYMICLLQWLWVMLLVLPAIIDSGLLTSFSPSPSEQPQHAVSSGPTSPILIVIGGIVTVLMLALTVLILIKFPGKVAQTGSSLTHKTADVILPVVTHHKPLPAKKKRLLTARLLLYIKMVLVIAPFIACFFVPLEPTFSREMVVFIDSFLATLAMSLFGLEHAVLYAQSRHVST